MSFEGSFERTSKLLRLKLDKRVNFACQYLEDRGLRFAIDYGYKTAIHKAAEIEAGRWLIGIPKKTMERETGRADASQQ